MTEAEGLGYEEKLRLSLFGQLRETMLGYVRIEEEERKRKRKKDAYPVSLLPPKPPTHPPTPKTQLGRPDPPPCLHPHARRGPTAGVLRQVCGGGK